MKSQTRFGDIAVLRKESVNPDSGPELPYLGLEHIQPGALQIKSMGVSSKVTSQKLRFHKGDILFGKLRPYFRKIATAPVDGICSTDIWVVRGIDPADNEFIKYWMASEEFIRSSTHAAEGSGMPRAQWDWVAEFRIPGHSSEARHAIGRVLGTIDEKIAANTAVSQTLEQIAQTIFKSWFVDFEPVHAKAQGQQPKGMDAETAELFPDSFKDSELGLIPSGWTIESLLECKLEIESGSRPKGGVANIKTGVPSIGAESINGLGVFNFAQTKFVPEEYFERMKRGKPTDFDVLLYKDGGKPGEFKPRVGMFGLGFPFDRFAINEHVFALRSSILRQSFLYFFIASRSTLDELRLRGIKAAIPGINQNDVLSLRLVVPTSPVLEKFDKLVQPFIEKILCLSVESRTLALLRDSLIPRLISGQLVVPAELLDD